MGKVRQHGTAPELAVRRGARLAGVRFTRRNRDLPGSPDLANRKRRVAVFVHGCYWHRHIGCPRTTTPRNNRAFWIAKFARNVERDKEVIRDLAKLGFRIAVIWECEAADIDRVVERLVSVVNGN
jgi:DNA mismatch endonuclease, patch repair protein